MGKGGFGVIYECRNIKNNKVCAAKIQNNSNKLLTKEANIYKYLLNETYMIDSGIPKVYSFKQTKTSQVMIMEKLNSSLYET